MLFFSLLWRDDWCCFSLFFGGMLVLFFSLWKDDWCCFSLFFGGMTGAVFLSLEG